MFIKTGLDPKSQKETLGNFNKLLSEMRKISEKNVIDIKIKNVNNHLNDTYNNVNKINDSFKGLGSSCKSIGEFFVKWYGTTRIIVAAFNELKGGVSEIIAINKLNTNMAMITNQSISDIEKLNQGYLDLAKNLKVLNSEVLNGAEAWIRSGASLEEVNENLKTSTKLSKIAGVSNQEMADSLITINKQFELGSEGLKNYASHVALLDNASTTTSEKINTAMQYSSETFKEYGFTIDEALTLVTNASERSARSGSSLGRGFVGMLTNFTKVQESVKNGDKEVTDAINKAELLMSKKGINLRKDADNFRNLNDVIKDLSLNTDKFSQKEKEMLAFNLGGKENKELFLSTINNLKRIDELKTKLMEDNGGKALDDSYSKYLDSIEAKMANLKNSVTQFWTNLIDSKTIKTIIGSLTTLVQTIEYLTVENKKLGISFVTLSTLSLLTVKNFTKIKFVIGEVIAFMQLLKTEGLATFSLLSFNPVTLGVLGVTAAIGIATTAIIKHVKHQNDLKQQTEELTSSYKSLTEAIKENNTAEIENQSDNLAKKQEGLKKLINDKKDLEKQLSDIDNSDMNFMEKATAQNILNNKLKQTNKSIEEQISILKKAGFTVVEATGEIVDLGEAQNKLNNTYKANRIKEMTQEEFNHRQEISALINEYQNLNAVENKNAQQKQRMSQIAQELNGKIDGLILTRDKEGNVVIQNTGLISEELTMLNREGLTVEQLSNIKLEKAKQNIEAQIGETKYTYNSILERIGMYEAEAKALDGVIAKREEAMFDTNSDESGHGLGILKRTREAAHNATDIFSQAKADIDKIFSVPKSDIDLSSPSSPNGYIPSGGDDESKKKKSDYTVNADKYDRYQSSIETINNALSQQDNILSNIKEKVDYFKEIKDFPNAIKESNSYLDQMNIKTDRLNSALSQNQKMKNEVANLIKKNYGFDITKANEAQIDSFYSKKFGTKTFSNESQKKAYEDNKNLFKQYADDYKKLSDEVTKYSNEIQKHKKELLDATKNKWELSFASNDNNIGKITEEMSDLERQLNDLENAGSKNTKQKLDIMNDIVDKQKQETQLYKSIISDLENHKSKLKDGSYEWNLINDKVKDYNSKLNESNSKLISLNSKMKEMANARMMEILERQIYDGMSQSDYERSQKSKIDILQQQLDALDKQNDALQEQEDRQKRLKEIEELRLKLENTKNEQNVRIYKDGKWQWVANQIEIDNINNQIKDKQESFDKWEKEIIQKNNRERIEEQIKYEQAQIDLRREALDIIKQNTENGMLNINISIGKALTDLNEVYNNKFTTIVDTIKNKVNEASSELMRLQSIMSQINGMSGWGFSNVGGAISNVVSNANNSFNNAVGGSGIGSAIKAGVGGLVGGLINLLPHHDTGGYIGDNISSNGALAVVDKKELILDSMDTKNVLDTIKFNKDILPVFNKFKFPDINNNNIKTPISGDKIYHFYFDKIVTENVDDFVSQAKTYTAVHA